MTESNLHPLAELLRRKGIDLRRVVVVRDEVSIICDEVRALAKGFDHVVTSGGVGPTHDDVTVSGVAAAFEVEVVLQPDLVAILRSHYKDACTDAHLAMARCPEGTTLEFGNGRPWPAMRMKNVWMLPGIPAIFRQKLTILEETLLTSPAIYLRSLFLSLDEPSIKVWLDETVRMHPTIEIGSYPLWPSKKKDETPVKEEATKVTFEGHDLAAVEAAVTHFLSQLPPTGLLRAV